ncbi:hypothetical protein HDU83_002063 [Entophlyctis luteolus]|nr:hypothetical protein HDU83_002063 [Entophlyctis luteolus]
MPKIVSAGAQASSMAPWERALVTAALEYFSAHDVRADTDGNNTCVEFIVVIPPLRAHSAKLVDAVCDMCVCVRPESSLLFLNFSARHEIELWRLALHEPKKPHDTEPTSLGGGSGALHMVQFSRKNYLFRCENEEEEDCSNGQLHIVRAFRD